ncbi:uncharacterized protein LOC111266839 [Varroa jacobsoni]|uniref:Uncharacterized protein n=1 Tax=Varroa destructor TaxID=109461 RepID=A0A7M7K100_VARDE|nr:uncharacterized protein LOC111249869 [Varroa destructor]XP_022700392.1 uncharacterized protein LOC111266839 [Varroa jacobsoni]
MADKLILFGVVALVSLLHLAHGALDHDLLRLYTANNLTFSCLPYVSKETITACDCMACNRDTPNFKDRMCKFFEEARKKGKADHLNGNLVNVCTSKAICPNIPNQCCNPSDSSPKYGKGCPLCLPAAKSQPTTKGHNPACLLAEYEAAQTAPPKGANWRDMYEAFDTAMREIGLHQRCASYALYKSAKLCDCEDCLQNEQNLREKWCRVGEKIRANEQLGRRGYMINTDYFKKFCDKKSCPIIPNKCCAAPTARDELNPVDRRGCPTCIPTSTTFGFGPRCRREITDLPQPIKLDIFNLQ